MNQNHPFSVKYQYSKKQTLNNDVWTIYWIFSDYVNLLNTTTAQEFRTPVVADEPASKFQLKMLLLGKYNDFIEIYYLPPSSVDLKPDVSLCEYTILNFNERLIIWRHGNYPSIERNKWQYLLSFSKQSLSSEKSGIICRLKLTIPNDFLARPTTVSEERDKSSKTTVLLIKDMTNLLVDETYSDVTLKSVEGDECRAHKIVLATRSQVLKAHFEHKTIESVTNVIETHFETKVLRDVLAYIYTSKALHIDDIPEKLFAAADYYQLSELKNLCEEAICRRLTVENAIDILILADLHSANYLKEFTLDFIKPQVHLIIKTEAWANLKSVQFELIKAILEYVHG